MQAEELVKKDLIKRDEKIKRQLAKNSNDQQNKSVNDQDVIELNTKNKLNTHLSTKSTKIDQTNARDVHPKPKIKSSKIQASNQPNKPILKNKSNGDKMNNNSHINNKISRSLSKDQNQKLDNSKITNNYRNGSNHSSNYSNNFKTYSNTHHVNQYGSQQVSNRGNTSLELTNNMSSFNNYSNYPNSTFSNYSNYPNSNYVNHPNANYSSTPYSSFPKWNSKKKS